MRPQRVDGAPVIHLSGEQDVRRDGRLPAASTEIFGRDEVGIVDAGRLSTEPAAIRKTAPEVIANRLHNAGHAVCSAVAQRRHGPAQPVMRQDHVRVDEGHQLARRLTDTEVSLEVSVADSTRYLNLLNYDPPVTDPLEALPCVINRRADQDNFP